MSKKPTNKRWLRKAAWLLAVGAVTAKHSSVKHDEESENDEIGSTSHIYQQMQRRERMMSYRTQILDNPGVSVLEEWDERLDVIRDANHRNRRITNMLREVHFEEVPNDLEKISLHGIGMNTERAHKEKGVKSSKKSNVAVAQTRPINSNVNKKDASRPPPWPPVPGKGQGGGSIPWPPVKPPPPPPVPRPTPPPAPKPPTPPPISDPTPNCVIQISLDFLQLSAIPPALYVNPANPNEQILGTRYVYNDGLRDPDSLDELRGSNISGTCTRTQARAGNADVGIQLGRGHCHFTYVFKDARDREISFSASGDVADSLGGVLSIVGGSKNGLGAYGELELLPVNIGGDGDFEVETGDFFLDPLFYLGEAKVLIPCSI